MHVRKRTWTTADGKRRTAWQARWNERGKSRTRTFRSKKAAESFLTSLEVDIATGGGHPRRQVTVGEWLDEWLADIVTGRVRSGSYSPTTAYRHEQNVRLHLRPTLGRLPLADLQIADVDRLMSRALNDGLKPATARKIRATLSKALTDAARRELVDRNVAQLAEPPTVRSRPPSAFTQDELDRLRAAWRQHPYGDLLEFVLLTGLRASEVVGLRWSDVDLDAGVYRLSRGLHRISGEHARTVGLEPGVVESAGKTDDATRETPMSSSSVALLRRVRLAQPPRERAAARWQSDDLVFTNEAGGPLDPSKVRRVLVEVAAMAKVPLITEAGTPRKLHELRRTWATRLRSAGVPVEDVARLGRWSSPRVLLEHYAATPEARLRDAAERAAEGL